MLPRTPWVIFRAWNAQGDNISGLSTIARELSWTTSLLDGVSVIVDSAVMSLVRIYGALPWLVCCSFECIQ
jgi:hypothetical protein